MPFAESTAGQYTTRIKILVPPPIRAVGVDSPHVFVFRRPSAPGVYPPVRARTHGFSRSERLHGLLIGLSNLLELAGCHRDLRHNPTAYNLIIVMLWWLTREKSALADYEWLKLPRETHFSFFVERPASGRVTTRRRNSSRRRPVRFNGPRW